MESEEINPLIMVFPYVQDATLKEIEADIEDDGGHTFQTGSIKNYLKFYSGIN